MLYEVITDIIVGNTKVKSQTEKFSALLFVKSVKGRHPSEAVHRKRFEDLTPIYPNERIHLEMPGCCVSMRMVDIISPIGNRITSYNVCYTKLLRI